MISKFFRPALFLISACAIAIATGATAQTSPPGKPEGVCPAAADLKAEQLYGLWVAQFTNPPAGLPARATMLLERHAEFSESLAGVVSRDLGTAAGSKAIAGHAAKAALAGDLDGGMLLLDESSDNVSITGTWNGEMAKGSCGKVFQGTWKDTSSSAPENAPDIPFTLTRLP
ncbi:hypothetical protein SAMN05216350_11150 [Polaromonas sp. YR568]|uniref:hypothetical protein n=1 Tax=Polaromonas sp. YR568 TaxID=1855301 RepID=UPI0008F37A57|nr:hypothetical protein [Polaromonas sp. YR568]SFU99502.1 hypothetical protein SAMN05216350_11150 [Polaromonas sp. YR568]